MDFRNRNIDLVGKQNLWFGISLAVILVGLFSWVVFGLNLGIDFRGGAQLQYRIPAAQRPATDQEAAFLEGVRRKLETGGVKPARPPQVIGGDTLQVDTSAQNAQDLAGQEPKIVKALGSTLEPNAQPLSRAFVGPIIGQELRRNAILGVLLGVSLIALWIYIRYNFAGDGLRYAVAGILALVHDVLVLIGLFALIGHFFPRVEIDSSFIAALLTVVGYSINDSVVIFDRIRENLRLRRREPFLKVVNDSLLETMSRSINTGLTVLIMLLILVLFGGEAIFNFVLAMLVGIASGLYSSIFNASMVLTAWHSWDEKKALTARDARLTPVRSAAGTAGRATTPRSPVSATPRSTPARSTTPRPVSPATRPLPTDGEAIGSQNVPDESASATATAGTESQTEAVERVLSETSPAATSSRPTAPRSESQKSRARRRY